MGNIFSFSIHNAQADAIATDDLTTKAESLPLSFYSDEKKIVFMDILKAHYQLSFDALTKTAKYQAILNFHLQENGFPAFDLVQTPETILIEQKSIQSRVISTPDGSSKIRILNASLPKGNYTVVIEGSIFNFLAGTDNKNRPFFNFEPLNSDKIDRRYLEQWLPSNLDFDYFQISFDVKVLNTLAKHTVFANGKIVTPTTNHFIIEMNKNSRSSGVYFHLTPMDSLKKVELTFKSVDGRNIPIQIYSTIYGRVSNTPLHDYRFSEDIDIKLYTDLVLNSMTEFEQKLGPYLHDQLIVRLVTSGGMEFDGAITTNRSRNTTRHELAHLWIGRGLNFRDGNSAWLDESLVMFIDQKPFKSFDFEKVCLTYLDQPYRRITKEESYVYGNKLIARLNILLSFQGGLLPFLKQTVQDHAFSEPLSIDKFIRLLDEYYSPQKSINFKDFFTSNAICE